MALKKICLFILTLTVKICISGQEPGFYPVKPVPFTEVMVTDSFWSSRIRTNREVTIPFAFRKCEETGRIDNFRIAGGVKSGTTFPRRGFDDSDLYKIMEGAAYSLASFTTIPYYAWAHRGAGEMAVWIPYKNTEAE